MAFDSWYLFRILWVLVSLMVVISIGLNLRDRRKRPKSGGGLTAASLKVSLVWSPEYLLTPAEGLEYLREQLAENKVDLVAAMLARFRKETPKGVYEGKYVKAYFQHWVACQVADKQGVLGHSAPKPWWRRI